MWNPGRMNLQKLAGLRSIIGLEITERHVRAVELKILGGNLDKFYSRFTAAKYLTFDIAGGLSVESSSAALKEELKRRGMRSHYAVAALHAGKVKTVRAEVPADVSDIGEWVQDNFEKLVRIPVPLDELAYRYEILQTGSAYSTIEFFFVRNLEIESTIQFLKSLNLDPIALSVGVRDSANPLLFTDQYGREGRLSFVFDGDDGAAMFDLEDGRITGSYSAPSAAELPAGERGNVLFAGAEGMNGCSPFMPFGISGEYTLAAGLAVRGFLPELHPTDFLPSAEKRTVMERLSKGLFQRVVLACGGVLLAILLLQSIFTVFAGKMESEIDSEVLQLGTGSFELAILEKQNASMRNELAVIESDSARTNVASMLYNIAKITPEEVWLYKITLTKDSPARRVPFAEPYPSQGKDPFRGKSGAVFLISGYSNDSRRIAEFVRLFENEPELQNVRIVRSGLPAYSENMSAIAKKMTSPLTFTLSLTAKLQ